MVETIVFEYSTPVQAQASQMRVIGDVPQSMAMQSAQRKLSAQNPGWSSLNPVLLPRLLTWQIQSIRGVEQINDYGTKVKGGACCATSNGSNPEQQMFLLTNC